MVLRREAPSACMHPRVCQLATILGLSVALVYAPVLARCAPRSSALRHFRVRRGSDLVTVGQSPSAALRQEAPAAVRTARQHLALLVRELRPEGLGSRLIGLLTTRSSISPRDRDARSADPRNRQFSLAGAPLRC